MGTICIIANHYKDTKKLFGAQTGFFEELSTIARRDGHQIFVVDINRFSERGHPITGYTFDLNHNCWKYTNCEMPFVFYDRYFPAKEDHIDHRPYPEITGKHFPVFNPLKATRIMNDKYESVRFLEQSAVSFPETELIDSKVYSSRLLNTKNRFVIKPRFGMKGRGIYFAERRGVSLELNITGELIKIDQLQERFNGYVIQERIDTLLSSNGKSADFRVLLQKKDGKLRVVGSYARTGDKNLPLNLASGGRIVSVEEWFTSTGMNNKEISQATGELETKALKAGLFLCSIVYGIFEIGMDFILDRDYKLWCLEANSKPARLGFKLLSMNKTTSSESQKHFAYVREQSLRNIIAFGSNLLTNQ